jgi:hypothetical protein
VLAACQSARQSRGTRDQGKPGWLDDGAAA